MKKSTVGLIIGGAVGVALVWLFRSKQGGRGVQDVPIRLRRNDDGSCGVDPVPDIELQSFFGPMRWIIANPAEGGCGTVTVRIANWKRGESDSEPPVIPVGPFERSVKPGQHKVLPAAANPLMEYGDYKYDVVVDGDIVLDPIVRLVL